MLSPSDDDIKRQISTAIRATDVFTILSGYIKSGRLKSSDGVTHEMLEKMRKILSNPVDVKDILRAMSDNPKNAREMLAMMGITTNYGIRDKFVELVRAKNLELLKERAATNPIGNFPSNSKPQIKR